MYKKLFGLGLLAAALPLHAADVDLRPGATQDDFEQISEDVVATINYKALGPAEATGLTGFSAGVFATYVPTDEDAWERATGEDIEAIGLVGLHATKGLPFLDIDVGAYYSKAPGTDIESYGAEIRYAILEGSTVTPALAIRAAYSKFTGAENWDVDSKSIDVSVSKGFALLTPYAGIGRVMGTSDPETNLLDEVDVEETRMFVGARISLGFIGLTPEYERIGENDTYSFKLALSL